MKAAMKLGIFLASLSASHGVLGCRGESHEETSGEQEDISELSGKAEPQGPEAPPYEAVTVSQGGAARGTVRISGGMPTLAPIPVTKDQEVCGLETPNASLRVEPGGAVENAVVSLVGISRGMELHALDGVAEVELVQCMAVPRIQIAPVGSWLEIVNSDPILHDVDAYRGDTEELFQVALPIQNFRARRRLEKPGMVTLRCGAGHPWMKGFVIVQEHPYYTLTDTQGVFLLSNIPSGSHRIRVWHEVLGEREATLTVEEGTTTTMDFELVVPEPLGR